MSLPTAACLALALVLLIWTWYELRVPRPLVNLRVSSRRAVLFTNLTSIVAGFSVYAMNIVLPQLLQAPKESGYGLGMSVLASGLCMAPAGVVMLVVSPASAWLSMRTGPEMTLLAGLVAMTLGYLFAFAMMAAAWQIVVASALIGALLFRDAVAHHDGSATH